MCNVVPYGSFGDTMGLNTDVAQELHELLCDIPLEIEDPEERDAGAETFIKRSISPG